MVDKSCEKFNLVDVNDKILKFVSNIKLFVLKNQIIITDSYVAI